MGRGASPHKPRAARRGDTRRQRPAGRALQPLAPRPRSREGERESGAHGNGKGHAHPPPFCAPCLRLRAKGARERGPRANPEAAHSPRFTRRGDTRTRGRTGKGRGMPTPLPFVPPASICAQRGRHANRGRAQTRKRPTPPVCAQRRHTNQGAHGKGEGQPPPPPPLCATHEQAAARKSGSRAPPPPPPRGTNWALGTGGGRALLTLFLRGTQQDGAEAGGGCFAPPGHAEWVRTCLL